jgi:hypothetical protein
MPLCKKVSQPGYGAHLQEQASAPSAANCRSIGGRKYMLRMESRELRNEAQKLGKHRPDAMTDELGAMIDAQFFEHLVRFWQRADAHPHRAIMRRRFDLESALYLRSPSSGTTTVVVSQDSENRALPGRDAAALLEREGPACSRTQGAGLGRRECRCTDDGFSDACSLTRARALSNNVSEDVSFRPR